jgi:hypothetical protein
MLLDENLLIRHLTTCILKQFLFFRFKKGCATKKSKIGNQKNAFSKYTELDGNMSIRHLTYVYFETVFGFPFRCLIRR